MDVDEMQTAQVAAQEGKYIGKKLHKVARQSARLGAQGMTPLEIDSVVSGPFRYLHLGSLAYIGNAAVFDLGRFSFMGGLAAMYAWRSIYWNEQVSARTRALLMIDWIIRYVHLNLHSVAFVNQSRISGVWGRDLSRL